MLAGWAVLIGLTTLLLPASSDAAHIEGRSQYIAPHTKITPTIDGQADDSVWLTADWREINYRWLGPEYSDADFSGRFKVSWNGDRIFILAEITDDILYDGHRDPLLQYWDDDCFEVFLDEDFSGGDHQYNHNAFAYHMSLDNRAVDIGTDKKPRDYSHHVKSRWRQNDGTLVWELAIKIYDDNYVDGVENNASVELTAGKIMGLMVAYCDNDGSNLRENFIGSESVPDGPKDRGWIDADLFGALLLAESQ